MSLVISDVDRDDGVVYLDANLRDVPSTHALVIGVGQYASDRLSPVSSPPLSARMIAEWFLDGMVETKPGGFVNAAKPLGSLSVLLSELPAGSRSQFADASIPRATFGNVKKAVGAWIKRASSHPDNFLFLFISSHGESFGRRTAFLLEDYGTEEIDVTAGMSEVEQFVEALANVDAKQQLLIFDCCRTPTSLGLRFDQEFGTRLINLPAATHGRIRRAHVLRSTGLGAEATGRKQGPTIFTQVLLDALRGLAASSSDNWTVDNFGLARTVARLLDLHERNGEPLQLPDSQLNAPFVVSAVPPIDIATIFVSLGPQYDFSQSRIRVMDDQTVEHEVVGTSGIARFARLELSKFKARTIAALDAAGKLIGETRIEPVPPVAFKELPDQFKVTRAAGTKGFAAGSSKGQIAVSLATPATSPSPGFVAVIRPSASQTVKPVTVALPADGRERAVTADPGWYDLSLDTSDGRTLFSKVNVKGGATTVVKLQPLGLDVLPSPSAQSADVPTFGGTTRTRGSTPSKVDPGLRTWLTQLGVSEERIADNGTPADVFVAPVSSSFSALLARERGGEPHPAPGSLDVEGAMLTVRSRGIFAVADKVPRRFPQRVGPRAAAPQLADQPVWVAAAGKGWREIAALPSLGVRGKFQDDAAGERDGWMPTLVVESTPRTTGSHVAAFVDTRQWAGLLAFLARRDFELGAVVMEDLVVDRTSEPPSF
jgi:Caspase domain